MSHIQDEIRAINRREDLTLKEKSKLISEVLNPKKKKEEIKIECKHYKRGCQLQCIECKKFYPCRLCHDEHEDHVIDRHKVKNIKCNFCGEVQEKSNQCTKCEKQFAKYYCPVCTLYDDDILDEEGNVKKLIKHCDKCGICRIGDNIHCDKCNMCFSREHFDTHPCEGKFDSNCPICNEDLLNSRSTVTVLRCKHTIHTECYHNNLRSGNYQCPLCKKSTQDMTALWQQIESYVNESEMPEEYQDMFSEVYCNDCEMRTITDFHFVYHKCKNCNSWNTNILRTFKM